MKKIILSAFSIFISAVSFAQSPIAFYPTTQSSGVQFGVKVASFNDNVLVSSASLAPMSQTGKTFLFNLTGGNLVQTAVLHPSDALISDNFGQAISLNDEFIAIGAPFHDENFENSGAVYLYQKNSGTWNLLQKITATDGAANNQFGTFVKIHNNQLFISSINYQIGNQDPNSNFGKVYVYSFNGTQWTQSQTLATNETFKFGEKIEFENNTLVVLSRENTNQFSAKFHTYNFNGSTWDFQSSTETLGSLEEKITDFSLSENQLFITSSSMITDKISIYDWATGNWNLSNSINVTNFQDQKVTRIEVSGDKMFLGSSEYTLQIQRKFPLRFYKKIEGNWIYQNAFYGTETLGRDDYFGSEIDLSGNNLIIGAPNEGIIGSGKAYYFDLLLSNEEFKMAETIIYPNPTKDYIYLKNNNFQNVNSLNIYSITGKLLLSKEGNLNQLSLQSLSSGIYFLKINYSNNSSKILKIIKE